MTKTPTSALLLGALVADAASLGLRWLYDPNGIAKIAAERNGSIGMRRRIVAGAPSP